MVSGVKIPSVPAGREEDVRSDTTTTSPLREIDGVERTSSGVGISGVAPKVIAEATEGDSPSTRAVLVPVGVVTDHGVTNDHTETLWRSLA